MRIRNTGESLSRPFPRLQRTRRCRGGPSHTDVKRRTSKCTPFPYRPASGLPPLLPAATSVSNASTCRRCPPPYLHRHRDPFGTPPTPSVAPPLDVATLSILLRGGLPTAASASRRTQAQPSRRPATRAPLGSRAAAQSVCTSNGKCLTTAPVSGLLPPAIPSAAAIRLAIYFASYTPSPPTQPTSQQATTPDGGCPSFSRPAPWAPQRSWPRGYAPTSAATARSQAQVHARRRPVTCRPQGKEEPHLEANRRLLSGTQLWHAASAVLHKAQSKDHGLDG